MKNIMIRYYMVAMFIIPTLPIRAVFRIALMFVACSVFVLLRVRGEM